MFNQILMYVAYGLGGVFILWFAFILVSITKASPEQKAAQAAVKAAKPSRATAKEAKTPVSVFSRKTKPAKVAAFTTHNVDNIGEGNVVPSVVGLDGEERKEILNPFTRREATSTAIPTSTPVTPELHANPVGAVEPQMARNGDAVEDTEVKPKLAAEDFSLDSVKDETVKPAMAKPDAPKFNLPF